MTSDTLSLFDVDAPRARRHDPATSKRAAERMAPAAPALERQILEVLSHRPLGLTKDEVCEQLRVDARRWPSVASALSRLKKAGKLEWAEYPIEHQNVWMLVQETVDVQGGRL